MALVVSELVGNAVRHGRALPGGGLRAHWDVRTSPGVVRLEVEDGGGGPGAVPAAAPEAAECGRGLALVGLLADPLGQRADPVGHGGLGGAARRASGPPLAPEPAVRSLGRPARAPEEPPISSRRRPPARPTGAPSPGTADAPVPVVGGREPCPCGSGKRYKACHGRTAAAGVRRPAVRRAGRRDRVGGAARGRARPRPRRSRCSATRTATSRCRRCCRSPGRRWCAPTAGSCSACRRPTRSGDPSRDLADALLQALDAAPGTSVVPTGDPGPGPRLQDVLAPDRLQVTVHEGFGHWVEGAADPSGEVAAAVERAEASVVPTVRLSSVASAYWCRMRERAHVRWALPEDEEPLLDALARLAVDGGLGLGDDTRYVGSFRAHGLLVPVWDLPPDTEAAEVEEPAAALRARLDEVLAAPRPLTARSGAPATACSAGS